MDLDALLDRANAACASAIADEEIASQPPGMLTPEQVRERAGLGLGKALEELSGRITSGFRILQEQYQRLNGAPGHERAIAFLEPRFFTDRETSFAATAEEDGEDLHVAEAFGIDLDDLSAAHDLAAALFGDARYEEASAALLCLTLMAPEVSELHLALGHAEYHCGRIENAVRCYAHASLCDPANPEPLRYGAHCLERLGDRAAAAEFRERASQILKEANP